MKILSLGSLNLDHVYSVEHFVKAGETIASSGMNDFCGGKGLNQSIALSKAGAEVYHAGKIGADGEILRAKLEENGVNVKLLVTEPGVPTGHAIIQLDPKGQNCIIIHSGANGAITEEFIEDAVSHFDKGDIALFQNEISNLDFAIECAAKHGMNVALNPSPMTDSLKNSPSLKYVKWFILNEIEGFDISGEKEPEKICRAMREKFSDCVVVLTLGKEGVVYYDGITTASHGIYSVPVVDTTAAGDTFAGYFLACTAMGFGIDKILETASKASSLAVSKKGAADSIPTFEQVDKSEIKRA
ncbi:MAG: ribokinase [Oscillospiraceae bacterium]